MTSDDPCAPSCSSQKIKTLIWRFAEYQASQQKLLEEIQKEANCLIESKEKLKAIANENARIVTKIQKRCREYKQENQALKQQLSLIKSAGLHEIPIPESDLASSESRGREDISSDGQPNKVERKGSKLSTNKQKKKVRYQKLSPEEKKSPVLSSLSQHRGGRENQDPKMQPPKPGHEERPCPRKSQKTKAMGQPTIREPQDLLHDQAINSVFVPETIFLDVDSDSDDYIVEEEEVNHPEDVHNRTSGTNRASAMIKDNSKRSRQENANDQYVVVPETVPVDSIPHSPPQDSETEYLWTGDAKDNTKFIEHLIPLEQSTPMLPTPSIDSSSRKTLSSVNSASPVYLDFKHSQKGRIPPTESQLSVNFSTTQMSPTFDGSRSTPNKEGSDIQSSSSCQKSLSRFGKTTEIHKIPLGNVPSTPENIHSDGERKSSISKASDPILNTPEDTNQAVNSRAITPDYDESGQSEASFLILQQVPSSRGPSQVQSSGQSSKEEAVHPEGQRTWFTDSECEQRKKRRLSDGLMDGTASKKTRTIKQEDISFDNNQRDENELCNRDGRQKVCPTRTETVGEPLRRQSSAGANVQKTHHKDKDDIVTETSSKLHQPSKNSSRSMKQTRLSKDSFKAVISKDGKRLKDLNGGTRVYVDSQDDPYMQQAIQESMKVQKSLNQDERSGNGSFKVPRLPKALDCEQKLKGSSSAGTSSRRPHVKDDDAGIKEDDREIFLLEKGDNPDYNNDGDLNGSLDPAVRFSFIGDEEDEDDHGEDHQKSNTVRRAEHGSVDDSRDIRKPLLLLPDDGRADHSRDRSSLHLDSKVTTHKASRASYEELDGYEVENKRRLLAEDSLDDMFEDDDNDDGGGPGIDEDRRDQGIEIKEGYGLGEDPETSVQGRTMFEELSLPDPGLDPVERRLGEADEMPSSFVREFDRPPQRDDVPAYKFKDVVRKRDERQKLKGFDCKECAGYYGGLGLTSDEIAQRTKNCSRHRGHHSPPNTPEHYWSIDFPDTATCLQRGYFKEAQEEDMPKRKRKMRYKPNFGKNKPAGEEDP